MRRPEGHPRPELIEPKSQGYDSDVFFLAKSLGSLCDLLRRHQRQAGQAFESVEFAGFRTGFWHAIGHENNPLKRGKGTAHKSIRLVWNQAKWKRGGSLHFDT